MSPLRSRSVANVISGGGAIDDFILEVTTATAENTGCRIPYDSLVHAPSTITNIHPITGLTLQPGDVIQGVRARSFAITVPGVTVRDFWVDGVGLNYSGTPGTDYHRLIDARACPGGATDADLVTYEFGTIDPVTSSYLNVGVQGSNFHAYRLRIRNVTDAFSPHSTGSQSARAVDIWGCYADDFYIDDEPVSNQADLITHNDFIQAAGKLRRLSILGNTVGDGSGSAKHTRGRPRTSNVLLQTNAGSYTGEGVLIRTNRFRGAQSSGSTVNCPVNLGVSFTLMNNIVDSTGNTPRVLIDATMRIAGSSSISGNVDENGNPTTINNA